VTDGLIKVLLVEDNPGDARLLKEELADAAGVRFDVTHAARLSAALERLEEERFAIVLLDLSLPDARGLDTVLKVQERAAHLPIVVLTGLESEELAAEALRKGAQDYLVKGKVDGELLVRSIRYAIERQRADEELQENLRRLKALQEIERAISTLDLRTVLDVLLQKIDILLPYSATTVRLLNKTTGFIEPIACRNIPEEEWKTDRWRGGRGVPNIVYESKRVWMALNVQSDPRVRDREFFRRHGLVSYLGLPLITKNEILGVLSFYTKQEHVFSDSEVEYLSTLADQAAIAIHNARLHEETERRRREAEEQARVTQSLTDTLDVAAVGQRIVASVRELFGVRAAMLRLLQPDGSLRAIASTGESFLEQTGGEILPPGVGLAGRAVAEGRLMQSADLLHEAQMQLTEDMRDYHVRSGNSSVLAAPLRAHENIIGTLGILERTGRVYSNEEVALLQTFANQAAVALENARLYSEAQTREKELKEINRMLSALHAVAAAASQSLDLEQVLRAAIDKISDIFGFDATQVHLYDESADEARLITYLEKNGQFAPAVGCFKRGEGIVGRVIETGKPLVFADAPRDPNYLKFSRSKMFTRLPSYQFFAVFPIKSKRRTLGTLACNGVNNREMKPKDIQLIEAMADQIAVAIENGELYAQIRQKFEELEQKTVALEQANKIKEEFLSVMSHELRTPLNAILGYTDMVRDGMLGPVNSEQDRCLSKVVGRARELLTMINGILQVTSMEGPRGLSDSYPVNLNEFFDELRSGYGFSSNKDVTLHWHYGELPMFETDPERLRHILQNLINNAIKFTPKGRVVVAARHLADHQRMEFKISDTGIGIPEDKMPIIFEKFRQVDSSETRSYGGVGLGLYIVKQYVDSLGGTIEVESTFGKGSCFTVTLPCASGAGSTAGKTAAA
jgi:signal transduction histidine kinase/DNA-binding NarL/FixJ family response regulator/uncharacterized protein YigA (DUF484 family)